MHARRGDPHRSYVDYPTAVLRTLDQKLDLSQHVCMHEVSTLHVFISRLPANCHVRVVDLYSTPLQYSWSSCLINPTS